VLDLTNVTEAAMAIGSLAGDGIVLLAGHTLGVGNNNLSTTFSGVIQESGALAKAGTGTLTLTGPNSYIGTTTVSAGMILASNRSGSATGTGSVNVNAGTLGGKGIIQGTVTIGTGAGAGAFLAPSSGSNQPVALTIKKTLTFKADSTYSYKLNINNARADQVISKGVQFKAGRSLVSNRSGIGGWSAAPSSLPSATLRQMQLLAPSPTCPTAQLLPPVATTSR